MVDAQYAQADLWVAKDLDESARRVAKLPLKFQPGRKYHYSIAVDVTGLVVQRISGQPFDEYLEEHIFGQLIMVETFFCCAAVSVIAFYLTTFLIQSQARPQTSGWHPHSGRERVWRCRTMSV